MFRARTVLVALALVAMLFSAGAASAAPGRPGTDRAPKAKLTWSQPRLQQELGRGQSATVELTFTSSADLPGLALRVPGPLGRITKVTPARFGPIKAGVSNKVTLTFAVPANAPAGYAHGLYGVVVARVGKHNIPNALKVLVAPPAAAPSDTPEA